MDATDTPVVVCDAGPLIHLDALDALDVLRDFQRILVPPAVWSEVEHHLGKMCSALVANTECKCCRSMPHKGMASNGRCPIWCGCESRTAQR